MYYLMYNAMYLIVMLIHEMKEKLKIKTLNLYKNA